MYGFRPHRNVLSCHFLVSTLMQLVQAKRVQGFYAAAMDLKSAYDTVSRPLLWQQLTRIGCSAHTLLVLENIYSDTQYALSAAGHVCAPFAGGLFDQLNR